MAVLPPGEEEAALIVTQHHLPCLSDGLSAGVLGLCSR